MSDPNNPSPFGSSAASTTSQDAGSDATGILASEEAPQRNNGFVSRVKEIATAQLPTQKDRPTNSVGTVAQAVRQSTRHLREQKHEAIAGYVDQAADQLDRLSQRLSGDVTQLLTDVQRLARRRPAVFIGGAFALGVIGARFLKSSSEDQRQDDRGNPGDAAGDRRNEYANRWAEASDANSTRQGVSSIGANVSESAERIVARVKEYAGGTSQAIRQTGRRAQSQLQRMMVENPLLVGAGAVMLGAAFGLAVPETRREKAVDGRDAR
jgi:hypothetical protein